MRLASASLCLGISLAACGGSSASPDATVPDARPDALIDQFTASGTVVDATSAAPIFGATICADGAIGNPCTMSAADGTYSFAVSVYDGPSEISAVTIGPGYLGRVLNLVEDPTSADNHMTSWATEGGLLSTADATTLLATQAGFTYPAMTTGFVQLQIFGATTGNAPAATASLAPNSGSGPVYADADGTPDPALTSTVAGSVGNVYFGNVAPGVYEVTVKSPGLTCTVKSGSSTVNGEWPPAAGGTLSVGVSANAITSGLAVDCT